MPLSEAKNNKLAYYDSEEKALSRSAVRQLITFVSTYLYETGILNYTTTKSIYRNTPNAGPGLRIQLSCMTPNINKKIVKKKEKPIFAQKKCKYAHVAY
jgi:hypothetical protein